jgi:Ca2+-binding RTX toxin-like protein
MAIGPLSSTIAPEVHVSHRQPIRRVRAGTAAFLLAGALLAAVLAPAASAAPPPGLYGATGVLGNDTAPPSNLYRIDPNTGAATTVGPIGYALGGLALDPTTGILYGVTTARELTSVERFLIRLDDTTGAGTVVGSLGTNHIGDIAFDNRGQLYGWSESRRADGGFAAVDDLVRINKATGAVTDVGDSGLNPSWGNGIAFDNSGVLFGSLNGDYGWLWTINPTTGAVNRGPRLTGSPNTTGGAGIAAATFGCGGTTLYGVVNDFGDPPTYLVTLDTTNGEITNRGTTVTALDALEWVCAAEPPGPPGPQEGRCANRRSGGTAGRDTLIGTVFGDRIAGRAGRDIIEGLAGHDCLFGQRGSDEVTGDRHNDLVRGGPGNDRTFGDSGRDAVGGGAGNDHVRGASGHDRVSGGSGHDWVDGGSNNDVVSGGAGRDRLRGGPGRDVLLGGSGGDLIETGAATNGVRGGAGHDRIFSVNNRRDTVRCGAGSDRVTADRIDLVSANCESVSRTTR